MTGKVFRLLLPFVTAAAAILLFIDTAGAVVPVLVIGAFGISLLLLLLPAEKVSPQAVPAEAAEKTEDEDFIRLREETTVLKDELSAAREDAALWKAAVQAAYNEFLAFEASLPVVTRLAGLITKKSEQSTIELTNNIFSIAEVSSDVSGKIHTLLEDMTQGDRSLESNISRLEGEMDNLTGMEETFVGILTGYREEISSLSTAISNIKEFTDSLTDLSERTHILAINASVEAARVGSKGAGFAVIAGEVQKLAARSKEIAGSIQQLTGRIDHQVSSSFQAQGEQIDQAVRGIQRSKTDVGDVVKVFAPQAKLISDSISESKRLSENVTENLNHITVSLQFQDYIRQVMEHILTILEEKKDLCDKNFPSKKLERSKKSTILEEEAKLSVEKYFTIRDEWEILGLTFEEPKDKDKGDAVETSDFGDNVSLF